MRKTLMGLAAAAMLLLGVGCGDDDDDTVSGLDLGGETSDTDASGDGSGGGGDDGGGGGGQSGGGEYPQEVQDNFMNACTSTGQASEEQCRCSLDALMESIPFDEYTAIEEALREDPSSGLPPEFIEAQTSCI